MKIGFVDMFLMIFQPSRWIENQRQEARAAARAAWIKEQKRNTDPALWPQEWKEI